MISKMAEADGERLHVTLKLATSLDGRIATRTGSSKWITGPESRARVHQMRAANDCVLTGIGTILADDPELTARTDPAQLRQPLRVVLDSNAATPLDSKLILTSSLGPVCLFHDHDHATTDAKIERIRLDRAKSGDGGLDLAQALQALQQRYTIASVLVEAGSKVAGSFLRAGLVDTLVWFRAPIIIGGDGLSVFSALGVDNINDALSLDCLDISRCGVDIVETYQIRKDV
jgi:diaminohydroxyphosphoribosylaminopyrimidine deaminase / 5-amino-6-(5-phosphoribosylamino)uracil reductase